MITALVMLTLNVTISMFFCVSIAAFVIDYECDRVSVVLKNGLTVVGTVNRSFENGLLYYSFRGIPFAEPPIGERRFKNPVDLPKNLTGRIVDASVEAPGCVQFIPQHSDAEDCLYLNIFTPATSRKLPVLVWIHGGGFLFGGTDYRLYGPDYLLEENIVLVTVNYRLGVFGFLSTEDMASPGNYGLMDQILALRWVRRNISRFGGRRSKVTLFGQSAGASSASYLSQTPLTKGLFQRAIFSSGNCITFWSLTKNPKKLALLIGKILKLNLTTTESLIKSLRHVHFRTLAMAQIAAITEYISEENILNGLPFSPTPMSSTLNLFTLVTNTSHRNLQNGAFHRIPYIMGFNSEEGNFFDAVVKATIFLAQYGKISGILVPDSLNIKDYHSRVVVNKLINEYYFGSLPIIASSVNIIKYVSDHSFNRPIIEAAFLYSQYSPIYFYKFSYYGQLGSKSKKSEGVAHTDDLHYLFERKHPGKATDSDILTRKRMVRLWTNFVKTGNPTPYKDSLLGNVIWKMVDNNKSLTLNYLNINNSLSNKVNPKWNQYIFWKNLFSKYGNSPFSTY